MLRNNAIDQTDDGDIHIIAINGKETLCGIDMEHLKEVRIHANCPDCIRILKYGVLMAKNNVKSGL